MLVETQDVGIEHERFSPPGSRFVTIQTNDEEVKEILILSLRDRRHKTQILEVLLRDNPIAFHGWGVSGVCGRVDQDSKFNKFWELKEGRAPGSKIPLLEPPSYIAEHVDWESVHPDFQNLKNPKALEKLWSARLPFHIILPYNDSKHSLSEAVVTPAFDPDVAPDTPVPTVCLFWINDPALVTLTKDIKRKDNRVQLGVSSLNEFHELPSFNTPDLLQYLQERKIDKYDIVVEDPTLESLEVASSHSQFVIPLQGQEPVWMMKRRGSLSAESFRRHTGYDVVEIQGTKVAARRAPDNENLDNKLLASARRIRFWYLKSLLHLS